MLRHSSLAGLCKNQNTHGQQGRNECSLVKNPEGPFLDANCFLFHRQSFSLFLLRGRNPAIRWLTQDVYKGVGSVKTEARSRAAGGVQGGPTLFVGLFI